MFASKVGRPQTKTPENTSSKLAPKNLTHAGRLSVGSTTGSTRAFQRGIGNQAALRLLAQRSTSSEGNDHFGLTEHETDRTTSRGSTVGMSAGLSDILQFPAERVDQFPPSLPQSPTTWNSAVAEAVNQANFENETTALPAPATLLDATTDVHVRNDAAADRSARLIGAEAFAFGDQILFRHGRYDPKSEQGRALIAHELTHVAHQRETGRSRPQRFVGGDLLTVQLTRAMAEAMTDDELNQQMDLLRSHLQSEPNDVGAGENLSALESESYSRQGTAQESPIPPPMTQQSAPPTKTQSDTASGPQTNQPKSGLTTGEKVLIGVLIGAAVVGGIAVIVLTGGATAPAVIIGLEAAGDVAAGTELAAGTTVVGEAVAGVETAAVATTTTEAAAGATATTASAEAATTVATVTAEDAVSSGLVNAGGRLASVLRAVQAQWTTVAPTTAMGALSAIQIAVRSLGLDIGIGAMNTDGSMTLTNVGGVLTTILTNGAIVITNVAGQVILRLP